jgi:DNA-binding NarL/FixJ family response regulator
MREKKEIVRVLVADDVELDRRVLKASLQRLAPEFEVEEHSEGATLLSRLLALNDPPRLLILDRAFSDDQERRCRYNQEMITLAQEIRKDFPQLDGMAILIYSRWSTAEEAAEFTNKYHLKGIWSRPKDVDHRLLVDHIRHILSQWPPRKP